MWVVFKKWKVALVGEFTQEFFLVHVVLERFSSIDENDRNLVIVLTAQVGVSIDVDLLPGEASAAGKLGKAFFDDLTQMAALAGVHHYIVSVWHARRF